MPNDLGNSSVIMQAALLPAIPHENAKQSFIDWLTTGYGWNAWLAVRHYTMHAFTEYGRCSVAYSVEIARIADDWEINNNFRPLIGRLLVAVEPQLDGILVLSESVDKTVGDAHLQIRIDFGRFYDNR